MLLQLDWLFFPLFLIYGFYSVRKRFPVSITGKLPFASVNQTSRFIGDFTEAIIQSIAELTDILFVLIHVRERVRFF